MNLNMEKCLTIAKQSKADIRFGAFVEKNGQIIGSGYNHIPTQKERNIAPRVLGQKLDYCIHAEEAALMAAVEKVKDLSGAVLYVLGFQNNAPIIRNKPFFTCKRCAERVLLRYDLPVRVCTMSGWKELTPQEAHAISLKFKNKGFWQNIAKNNNVQITNVKREEK